ncbi:MAG: hypothetical protein K8U57_21910 [Planctomycetes bacterium]|nr:hypothetical protein [Planctomycetota bacterium]
MKRLLTMVVALLGASVALADIGPPPGFKRVPLEHKVTTEKDYPDYLFYSITGVGTPAVEVKLDSKTPATLTAAGGGPGRAARLVAVPKEASKKFDNEKEYLAAVGKGKVEGMIRAKTTFWAFNEVKEADAPKVIVKEYKIEKIDPKEGIVYTSDKDAKDAPKLPLPPPRPGVKPIPDGCDESDEEPTPIAYTPKGGTWIAGLAGACAFVFGGLWIVRRGRRELA